MSGLNLLSDFKIKVRFVVASKHLDKQAVMAHCNQTQSVTHPITRAHHGLLLAAQFVEDVVGQLNAASPQLSCREQDARV